MKQSRTIGCLLGTIFLLLGMGKAAWAVDYSGTLDFNSYTTTATFPSPFGGTISGDVGLDIDRYNLGNALDGSTNISITTHNAFNTDRTVPAVLFTDNPNDAIFNDPTSLAAFINPTTNINTFLNDHVPGWLYFAYGTAIAANGTTSISGMFAHPLSFVPGTTYYAFVVGGSAYYFGALTDSSIGYTLSVGAVPEPGEYAMMIAGLGLIGLMRRRRNKETVSA